MHGRFDGRDVAGDYRELLRRGSVMRRLAVQRHAAWQEAMKASATADDHRIRTWSRKGPPPEVWATLPDWSLTRDEHERLQQRLDWLRED